MSEIKLKGSRLILGLGSNSFFTHEETPIIFLIYLFMFYELVPVTIELYNNIKDTGTSTWQQTCLLSLKHRVFFLRGSVNDLWELIDFKLGTK